MATQAGFVQFIRSVMQIGTTDLPDASLAITWAYNVALGTVNTSLALSAVPNTFDPSTGRQVTFYDLAVYNLAADNLVNYAIDAPGTAEDANGNTFFEALRFKWGVGSFSGGVVNSVSDVSTSTSLTVPDALAQLTLADLQNLKTPYGRQYLAIAQRYGTIWGLS